MKRISNAEMSEYTSFKAGGKADLLVIAENIDELCQVLRDIDEKKSRYLILGNGTNTLVTDKGFRGTIVKLGSSFSDVSIKGNMVVTGAGALISAVSKAVYNESLAGMEALSGIPGSIGGAVFMNAGAYGSEIKDILEEIQVVSKDGKQIKTYVNEQLDLSYRHSVLQNTGEIITSATFKLQQGSKEKIKLLMKDFTQRRNEKQPVQYPSGGSFFKRPEGYFAGKLIQDSGLKGLSVGGAQVSELHSGFVINKGGATATDIIRLMNLVQNTVFDKYGVKLEPEVRIVGEL